MRAANTYRSARRNEWRDVRKISKPGFPAWWAVNRPQAEWQIGSVQRPVVTMRSRKSVGRSAYMPHDGGGRFAIDRGVRR